MISDWQKTDQLKPSTDKYNQFYVKEHTISWKFSKSKNGHIYLCPCRIWCQNIPPVKSDINLTTASKLIMWIQQK